jgi:hypothetical protein
MRFLSLALILSMSSTLGFASSKPTPEPVSATVLKVERVGPPTSNYVGDNPTDAPLQADVFAYNLSVRANCGTYTGHYESPTDYIPTAFVPSNHVMVRLTKHVMYVDLPGEKEMPMSIVHKHLESGPCDQARR